MRQTKLFILSVVLLYSCVSKEKHYQNIIGEAQGTTFSITYHDSIHRDFSGDLKRILINFDQELSTYKPGSIINQFNDNEIDSLLIVEYDYLPFCFMQSIEMKDYTGGYFDAGLENIFSNQSLFGFKDEIKLFPIRDSILNIPSTIKIIQGSIVKEDLRSKFNFNAIAQGYSVDVICDFFDSCGIRNYMVEIGGEVRVKGKNPKNEYWTISLEAPNSKVNDRVVHETIQLNNLSVVTSGSYRKFKEINGVKYSHAINPRTGFGVTHNLLSVSVITENCAIADALATAFLVMGKEQAIQFLEKDNRYNVSLMFIESTSKNDYVTSFYGDFESHLTE